MNKDTHNPMIITFIGPVGVGKTTQMTLLKRYFEKKNKKTLKTYIKSTHGLSYLLVIFFRKLGISKKITGTDGIVRYQTPITFQKRITKLWNLTETISLLGKFFLTVYLPFTFGYNVLIEEGLWMSYAHYREFRPYFLGVKPKQPLLLSLLIRWVISKKHLDLVLDAKEPEIIERRKNRTFRRNESKKFIELQRKAFSNMKGNSFLQINTSGKSISSVNKIIVSKIEELTSATNPKV
jgi:DNA polymerase III delta prime subunit